MNKLTQFLVDSILKEETLGTVALFGGGFKPPTKGHLEVVLQGLKDNPDVQQVYILVGSGERNGVTQEEAIAIWKMYQKFIPVSTQIISVQSPFSFIKDYLTDHPDEKVYIFIGARDDNEEDEKDVAERSKFAKKYSENAMPVKVSTTGGVSGTKARQAALSGNQEEFLSYFPEQLSNSEKEEIVKMISDIVKENLGTFRRVVISGDRVQDTQIDLNNFVSNRVFKLNYPYLQTKIIVSPVKPDTIVVDINGEGADTIARKVKDIGEKYKMKAVIKLQKPMSVIKENATYSKDIDITEKLAALTNHMRDKGYKIDPLPAIEFINGDTENARDFFGKTAYYDPNEMKIVLYTEGRHPKDIVRSFAHEMIHHVQNLEGRLNGIQGTNTTEDDNLQDIEKEAYLDGNISFRNWTDDLQEKKNKDPFGINAYALELARGLEESLEEGRPKKKDPKKGTGKKPEGSGRRLYTDEDPKDTVRIKFKTKEDIVDTLNKKQFKAKSHARQSQVINLIHQRVRAAYGKAKDPEVKSRLKRALDYIESRKEASKKKTERLRNLNEGAYDSIVSKLAKDVLNAWKSQHDEKPTYPFAALDTNYELEDAKGRPLDFDLLAKIDFKKTKDRKYVVDGGANEGDDEVEGFVSLNFQVDPRELPKMWSTIAMDIRDVLRHEIEHLTQGGWNVRSDKEMEDDSQVRDLIQKYKLLAPANYFLLDKEVDAMLQGMYFKAKKLRRPMNDVVNDYLALQPVDAEEKETILSRWRSRAKSLSLPLTENEEMPESAADLFTIYLDMDGVIVNFDKQFEKLTGMGPREFESNFGKEKFWDKITKAGVGFWRSMEWMPGGQALYNRVAQHNHFLLSAPSQDESSKIGKRMWRKDNTPNTRLILSAAKNKPNYADKSNILIDDRKDTIDAWKAKGGIGILYTSASQVMDELDKLGL